MRKICLLICIAMVTAGVASAQLTYNGPAADVLGAHNGYGRGCVMCHAPHSGALGNGITPGSNVQNGMYALWGQDLSPLYGKTFNFSGDGKNTYPVTLPSVGTITSAHDANTVVLMCLSCHDGVLTSVGMMQGQTVETLPIVGGTAPTLLAKAAPGIGGYYSNDHPVGGQAMVGCGGGNSWDCAGGTGNTPIWMTGTASAEFLVNYPGSFWNNWNTAQKGSYSSAQTADSQNGGTGCTSSSGKPSACVSNPLSSFNGTTVNAVSCTTCHDQHSMTIYTNANGTWSTMFFVRGKYTPYTNGNSVAQFCRNCHGGESNEMHGLTNVPTI